MYEATKEHAAQILSSKRPLPDGTISLTPDEASVLLDLVGIQQEWEVAG